MNELFPRPGVGIDPDEAARDGRPGTDVPSTRWVAINMVMSLDGAIAVNGRSGGLGGPADRAMFRALRGAADVVLVGAETVRAERYHRTGSDGPAVAVVSASARFPTSVALFDPDKAGGLPLLFTTGASAEGLEADGWPTGRAEVVAAAPGPGGSGVSVGDVIDTLVGRGMHSILCEGGPRLLTHLAEADLVDEWNITLASTLAGVTDSHLIGPLQTAKGLRLDRVCEEDGTLLLRYGRRS